jgi:hypothetical protein
MHHTLEENDRQPAGTMAQPLLPRTPKPPLTESVDDIPLQRLLLKNFLGTLADLGTSR